MCKKGQRNGTAVGRDGGEGGDWGLQGGGRVTYQSSYLT